MILPCLLLGMSACTHLPEPFGIDEEESTAAFPPGVQKVIEEADRLQRQGDLRGAILVVEHGLIDFPESSPIRARLGELRSQRQVCFRSDWDEVDSLLERRSPSSALAVLRRIQRYGDSDMARQALEREGESRSRYPEVCGGRGHGGGGPRV